MDNNLFMFVYKSSLKYTAIRNIMVQTTKLSSILFKTLYTLFILFNLYIKNKFIYLYIILPFITLILVKTLQKRIKRQRPFIQLNIKPLVAHKASGSFPSTHAASSMIIALCIGHAYTILMLPVIALSIFTGLSRIATGLHYPTDVLAGFMISCIIFYIALAV